MGNWGSWIVIGLLLIAGGGLALANPFAASLAVELLVGWIFLIAGVVQLYAAFRSEGDFGLRLGLGLWALLVLVIGVSLVADPLAGLVTLTFLLGIVFTVSGLLRLALAWGARNSRIYWVLLLSGALSVLIGIAVLANFQQAATALLGIVLAVELISNGIGAVAYGLALRDRS
ncbi:MAG: hypothetical protein CMH66_00325 [Nioella sp.]|nr:hypothetical protein [Nioella sp.]